MKAGLKCKYDNTQFCVPGCTAERCYFRFGEEMFRNRGERKEMKRHIPRKLKHYKRIKLAK